MKKYVSFALIFAVIVVVHILVIRMVFKKTETSTDKEPATSSKTEQKNDQPDNKGKQPAKENAAAAWMPFNYRYAYMNKIPGLPACAQASTGILIDPASGFVLWAKNPRKGVPIASMTKMMTLLLAMEDINKNPAISLETKVTVGKAASKIGGTQVFLKQGEVFPVSKLMESMLLRSANDSAYQVAEFFGDGDVSKFIAAMNVKATELKMPGTKFYNPNGLPGDGTPDNISSPEGLAIIAEQMLKYPKIMEWSSTRIGHFREKTSKAYQMMVNTNKLVSSCPGVDGLKTGYISASGFCVTVTCKRGDRRLIAVVTGFKSAKERNHFVAKLLDWGYKRCVDIESREKQRDSSLAKSK